MVWLEVENRCIRRMAFQWDGTQKQLNGHFSTEEQEQHGLRVMGRYGERFMMLKTLHGPSHTEPRDWIIKVEWPSGVEVYSIKPQVFKTAYRVFGEVEQWPSDLD